MIARFDHRPMLTALLALTTTLLVAAACLPPTLPLVGFAAWGNVMSNVDSVITTTTNKGMAAGGAKYGIYDYYSHQPQPAQTGDSQKSDSAERQEVGHP